MKTCTKCRRSKTLGEFNKRSSSSDGLAYWCKPCQAGGHKKSYEKSKSQYRDKNKCRKALIRTYIRQLKQSAKCADCDEDRWVCLSFDHLADKTHNISGIENYFLSLDRVQEELDKCEIVCHNCHAIRTHARRNAE